MRQDLLKQFNTIHWNTVKKANTYEMSSKQQTKEEDFKREQEQELLIVELKKENEKLQAKLKRCRTYYKEALSGETEINDKVFQVQIDQIDRLIGEEETCPYCYRFEYECEKETDLEKNPITYWLDANWGMSCDECWYAAHPESDDDEDEDDDNV
jgi:hypothetical protein